MKDTTKRINRKRRRKLDFFEQLTTLIILICLGFIILIMFSIYEDKHDNKETESEEHIIIEETYNYKNEIEVEIIHDLKETKPTIQELCYAAQKEIEGKMSELSYVEDVMQWYVEYKELANKHSELLGKPSRIYDEYSDDDIYLMQRAVETETYQCYFMGKVNVASVILNRISDGRFGDSVKKIITNPGQFAYHRTKISESTILAVEFAYEIGDTTDGCLAFRSDRKSEKWGKWEYCFSDNSVHHFYK